MPLRTTLQTVERMTGRRPKELDGPEMPEGGRHLWHWFIQMRRRRDQSMGASPITHLGMAAFFLLHGIEPQAWEIYAIEALDDLSLRIMNGA